MNFVGRLLLPLSSSLAGVSLAGLSAVGAVVEVRPLVVDLPVSKLSLEIVEVRPGDRVDAAAGERHVGTRSVSRSAIAARSSAIRSLMVTGT
jgi:hypothetical protein